MTASTNEDRNPSKEQEWNPSRTYRRTYSRDGMIDRGGCHPPLLRHGTCEGSRYAAAQQAAHDLSAPAMRQDDHLSKQQRVCCPAQPSTLLLQAPARAFAKETGGKLPAAAASPHEEQVDLQHSPRRSDRCARHSQHLQPSSMTLPACCRIWPKIGAVPVEAAFVAPQTQQRPQGPFTIDACEDAHLR